MSEVRSYYTPNLAVEWTENINNSNLESEWIALNINSESVELTFSVQNRVSNKNGSSYLPVVIEMKPEFLPNKYNVCTKGYGSWCYLKEHI